MNLCHAQISVVSRDYLLNSWTKQVHQEQNKILMSNDHCDVINLLLTYFIVNIISLAKNGSKPLLEAFMSVGPEGGQKVTNPISQPKFCPSPIFLVYFWPKCHSHSYFHCFVSDSQPRWPKSHFLSEKLIVKSPFPIFPFRPYMSL